VSREFQLRIVGDRAWLVELPDNAGVHALADAVRGRWDPEIEDVVPGEQTLLISWRSTAPPLAAIEERIGALVGEPAPDQRRRKLTVPVRYDGADLEVVALRLGIDRDRVVQLHTSPEYTVAFLGFAPGFAYLIGGSEQLAIPRRADPRPRVAAGSVAIAAHYSGVYPVSAPGGWHLLGHTDLTLFDPDRNPPALLEPGMRVSFQAL
jgi:KipI family sensor histidine kinase inhibitor